MYLDGDLKDYAKNQHSWLSHEEDSSYELGAFSDFARIDTAEMQAEATTATTTPSREQKMAQGMSLVEVAGVSEAAAAQESAVHAHQDHHTHDVEAVPQAAVDEVEM